MRTEIQVKFEGTLSITEMTALGAAVVAETSQVDLYLYGRNLREGSDIRRIRQEGGSFILSERGYDAGAYARVERAWDEDISEKEAKELVREYGEIVRVEKTRRILSFPEGLVCLDSVSGLGDFIEVRARTEDHLALLVERVGLSGNEPLHGGYFELMCRRKLPKLTSFLIRTHDRVASLTFGIVSASLNSIGFLIGFMMIGLSSAAAIAPLLVVSGTDSFNDAASTFFSKMAERGVTRRAALRAAVGTFLGKVLFTLSFVVFLHLAPGMSGTVVALIWAVTTLVLLSADQATVAHEPVWSRVKMNIGIGLGSAILSLLLGAVAGKFLGQSPL